MVTVCSGCVRLQWRDVFVWLTVCREGERDGVVFRAQAVDRV